MFSSRLPWDLRPNGSHLRSKPVAAPARPSSTSPNPPHAGRLLLPRASRFWKRLRGALVFYEPSRGLRRGASGRGRATIARAATSRAGTNHRHCQHQRIYAFLFKLLADPAMRCWSPSSYPLFEFLAALESVRPVPYPLVYHGAWSVDFDALERSLNSARGPSSWSIRTTLRDRSSSATSWRA